MSCRAIRSVMLVYLAAAAAGAQPSSAQDRLTVDEASRRESLASFRTGQELMSDERFGPAADEFTKAIAKNPLLSIAYYQLGQANMNMQRYATAVDAYKSCIEAERKLFTLRQTDRFAVEKQRDDEIKELRNILSTGKGRTITVTQLEQRLRDLENQRS